MNKHELIGQMNRGFKPVFLGFFFDKPQGALLTPAVFSNFYKRSFTLPLADGTPYIFTCVEQYMMYAKACHFGDAKTAQKILDLGDVFALQYKKLGRQVKPFNDKEWSKVAPGVVKTAVKAKFEQNEDLKRYLIHTGEKVLVEDSPYDRIWGSGVAARDKTFKNPAQWPGLNQLGFILMDVRDELKT